ncbi:MAG: Lrp/AsnC family transcriptional regulator [Anaerolineae bacterium]|nr:MAG: Lrp/AsnC family transcriptional regulator [Anaerolineae bacterium]
MGNTGEYEDVVAFVLIKTEPKAAAKVAAEASTLCWTEEDEVGVTVRGVRWAAVVADSYNVMAAVRVRDEGALEQLVQEQIRPIEGIVNPSTLVVEQLFRNGQLDSGFEHNTFP